MQVVINVPDDPDFHPPYLDLDAPPPVGTNVKIDRQWFTVTDLLLTSHPRMGDGRSRNNYYTVTLTPRRGEHPPIPGKIMKWTADLAPLGVDFDGRLLAANFTIFTIAALDNPVPLIENIPSASVIGTVDHVEVREGMVVASGTVNNPGAAARMGKGELRPQMDLSAIVFHDRDGTAVLTSATLGAVVAGTRPAWPEARFTIVEES